MNSNRRRLFGALAPYLVALCTLCVPSALASSYRVFAYPLRDPAMGPRTLEIDPDLAGGLASPFGWHDVDGSAGAEYTITRGNNVYAFLDVDGNGVPDVGGSPDGGAGLAFDFPLDLAGDPALYGAAAVANAYYWVNVAHDILWIHGFDEANGNFQENNYGRGGLGGDAIQMRVQDGGFPGNGSFTTGVDGTPSILRIGIWDLLTASSHDIAFANEIVVALVGSGMMRRVVAGPGAVCFGPPDPFYFGVGDWLGLLLTRDPTDGGMTARGFGAWMREQAPTDAGIRPFPYSTDMVINPTTFAGMWNYSSGQDQGTVVATILWDLTWQLISQYGSAPSLYDPSPVYGDTYALQLVIQTLSIMPCDNNIPWLRDSLIFKDSELTGGANECLIWRTFARRGVGVNAVFRREDFSVPAECEVTSSEEPSGFGFAVRSNPVRGANTMVEMALELPRRGTVTLEIFDLRGALVFRSESQLERSSSVLQWNGRDAGQRPVAAGVYHVRVTTEFGAKTKQVVLLR